MALITALLGLLGCDPQRIKELEEGVSTEADVRARFGTPEATWEAPAGARIFEYNRNPAGHQNYMITIGADGKMSALRQVLNPDNFARVRPGMSVEEVRRMLGKPAKRTPYELTGETVIDWRYMQPPSSSMLFSVAFDRDLRVLRTASLPDPEAPDNKGGPN